MTGNRGGRRIKAQAVQNSKYTDPEIDGCTNAVKTAVSENSISIRQRSNMSANFCVATSTPSNLLAPGCWLRIQTQT